MPLDVEYIRRLRPQNPVHYFPTVGSTMTEAARLAAAQASSGTVVLADEQTAGMGRLGRSWHSQSDTGIYSTTLLRLQLSPESVPLAALMLGLATAEAITQTTGLICDLRWPNDVLIAEKKTAGILAQFADGYILAGIGINVNQRAFPEGLRTPATSLCLESGGRSHSREEIIVGLLGALESYASLLAQDGPAPILRAFTAASSYAVHRRVVVEETAAEGVTAGLDETGFLLLRRDDGRLERITSGGIRPAGSKNA